MQSLITSDRAENRDLLPCMPRNTIEKYSGRRTNNNNNNFLSKSESMFLNGELECDRDYEYVVVHRLKKKLVTLGETLELLAHNDHTREWLLETLQKTVSLTEFSKIERDCGFSGQEIENSQIEVNCQNKAGLDIFSEGRSSSLVRTLALRAKGRRFKSGPAHQTLEFLIVSNTV